MLQITPGLVAAVFLIVVASMLVGIALHGWLAKQPQPQVIVNAEAEAFKLLTESLTRLADTSDQDKAIAGHQQAIAAIGQIKATKAHFLQQAAAAIAAKAAAAIQAAGGAS